MYTNPNPNLTPQCRARKYGRTDRRTDRRTDGQTDDGPITIAHPEHFVLSRAKKTKLIIRLAKTTNLRQPDFCY